MTLTKNSEADITDSFEETTEEAEVVVSNLLGVAAWSLTVGSGRVGPPWRHYFMW